MKTRIMVTMGSLLIFLCILMMGCGKQSENIVTDGSGITSADEKIVNDIKRDIPQNASKVDIYKDKDGNISFGYETEDGAGGGGMVLK